MKLEIKSLGDSTARWTVKLNGIELPTVYSLKLSMEPGKAFDLILGLYITDALEVQL